MSLGSGNVFVLISLSLCMFFRIRFSLRSLLSLSIWVMRKMAMVRGLVSAKLTFGQLCILERECSDVAARNESTMLRLRLVQAEDYCDPRDPRIYRP